MKYSDDGKFEDPIVRCDSCNKLIDRAGLLQVGMCPHCGHRKVRKVLQFAESEIQWARENLDPEFMALFEEVDV